MVANEDTSASAAFSMIDRSASITFGLQPVLSEYIIDQLDQSEEKLNSN